MARKTTPAPKAAMPEITDEDRRQWALNRIESDQEGWARMFKWYSEKHHYHWAVSLNRERRDILEKMDEYKQYGGDPSTLPPVPVEIEEVLPPTAGIIMAEDIDAAINSRKHENTDKFFESHQSIAERAKHLKDGAGLGGGGAFYYPDGISGWLDHNAKGLQITKGNYRDGPTKLLTWNAVARRMSGLLLPKTAQPQQPHGVEFTPVPVHMISKRVPAGQLSFLDLLQ